MLDTLLSKGKINQVCINNRFVVPAMVTNYCDTEGKATDRYIAYHEEKAKGGWGLIITENIAINKHCMGYACIPGLYNDGQIASHKKLTETVQKYGTKIFAQLYHAGRQSSHFVNGDIQPIAPSSIPCPWLREIPREMTKEDIQRVVNDFANAAFRAKKAGFDGVEIHAGHGYLLAEFLSTYANKRTDEYGGCLDNRVRIVKEVYEAVRNKVGKDFAVIVRMSAFEGVPGGRDIAETRVLVKLYEEWGFDAINISNGVYGDHTKNGTIAPMYVGHAVNADFAREVKKIINIPVIVANRINDPRMAESLLDTGVSDFIAMGRGSIADPALPNKAKEGKFNEIRYCIGCLQGCAGPLYFGGQVTCLVNPSVGIEYKTDFTKVENPKKICVVGAGPAGLETALNSAKRGHKVTLIDKNSSIGGQFRSAAYPPCKGEFTTYLSAMNVQLKNYNIDVKLNTEATKESILAGGYDDVVIATGGLPLVPNIKGIDKANVFTAEDVLLGKVTIGDNVVIAGGGEVGSETAAHLAMEQKNVTIVEMKSVILEELDGVNTLHLEGILDEFKVKVFTDTKVVEILDDGVKIENKDGAVVLPAQSLVLAFGYRPNRTLADELKELASNVHVIAGATKTSNALVATREGFDLGVQL